MHVYWPLLIKYIDERNFPSLPSEEIEFNILQGRSGTGPCALFILRQFRESNHIIDSKYSSPESIRHRQQPKTTENSRKLSAKGQNERQTSQLCTCAEHRFEPDLRKLSSWGLARFRALCTFLIDQNASNDVSEHQIRCRNDFETFLSP